MPWVKISSDAHKDMKQYLVDIEGMSLGELVEASFEYAMENLGDFEKFLHLDEHDEEDDDEEDEDQEDNNEKAEDEE